MTALRSVVVKLPTRLDECAISRFEFVFSELLDSAATSHWRDDDGQWQIEALFESIPDVYLIDQLLDPLYRQEHLTPVSISVNTLEQRDWLAENRTSFPPLHIGRFWVYGSHVVTRRPAGSLPIKIDASLAFGAGTHPTTQACLRAIQMMHFAKVRQILDLGCGSAILAVAAARLWPSSRIIAADSDPVALGVAAKNRSLNKISYGRMRLALTDGFGSRIVRNNAPYDLVLANILARPLTRMASVVAPRLSSGSWLVLSGILSAQASSVEAAYRAQNLRAWHRICLGDWITIIMRPASAGTVPQLWGGL